MGQGGAGRRGEGRKEEGRGGEEPTYLPQVFQLPDFGLVGGTVLSKVPRDQLLVGGGAGAGLLWSPSPTRAKTGSGREGQGPPEKG